MSREIYTTTTRDNFMRNSLKYLSRAALTTANRLSFIIASLLRIVAPSDISTAYAINNTLPPTHRPCRDYNVLRMYMRVQFVRARVHTLHDMRNREKFAPCFTQLCMIGRNNRTRQMFRALNCLVLGNLIN